MAAISSLEGLQLLLELIKMPRTRESMFELVYQIPDDKKKQLNPCMIWIPNHTPLIMHFLFYFREDAPKFPLGPSVLD